MNIAMSIIKYLVQIPMRMLIGILSYFWNFFSPSFLDEKTGVTSSRKLTGFAFVVLIFYCVVTYVNKSKSFDLILVWIILILVVSVLLIFVVITFGNLVEAARELKDIKEKINNNENDSEGK